MASLDYDKKGTEMGTAWRAQKEYVYVSLTFTTAELQTL